MNITVKTKLDQTASEITVTNLTIDWSNATKDDLHALATRSIVIAAQTRWRKSGVIPTEATIDAHECANPQRKGREKISDKERAARYIKAEMAKGRSIDEIMAEMDE